MKQTSRIISTYSADVFGVCSALFELGGMTVMHDASGCNSTYTTHDEPRWYDMDSMVYISALTEMEAILGDDEKLISDIAAAAEQLHPRFIALAGTPIPAMTGFDYAAAARLIRERTGIPAFGFPTTGMDVYVRGAGMAFAALARELVQPAERTKEPSVNILGLTPLDFSVNGTDRAIAARLEKAGWKICSRWAMGSDGEELSRASAAHANLVVSETGLEAAKILRSRFGIPYVAGVPYGKIWSEQILRELELAAKTGENRLSRMGTGKGEVFLIGESVGTLSLACAIELETGLATRVISPTGADRSLLRPGDLLCREEQELETLLKEAKTVIADPLYRPICPENAKFVELPTEAFSGRMFREKIPELVMGLEVFLKEVL